MKSKFHAVLMVTAATLLTVSLSQEPVRQMEVVVVGGGIAGLAAAREIVSNGGGRYNVKVFEARRDRYGGRVWTDKLKHPKARGLEVDLGASTLNIASLSNPLLNLTRDLELETAIISRPLFIVPWLNKRYSDNELMKGMVEASSILSQAVNKSRVAGMDLSVRQAVEKELQLQGVGQNHLTTLLVQSLPSYILEEYSVLQYQPDCRDFGFEQVLLDGMGELLDRLVSGSLEEPPLKVSLRTAVRQIKVDRKQDKVTLRLKNGSQVTVDKVIVAVPGTVIASGDLLFEPVLPKQYLSSLSEMGIADGNKVIVEFDAPFWPADFGLFVVAAATEAERGHLNTWINVHLILGKPVLMGLLLGEAAKQFETLTDDQVKTSVIKSLQSMFGAQTVSEKNIVRILRTKWSSDPLAKGASTYPHVGNTGKLWDVLSEPLCPGVYFAGEHTMFRGHGTLQGAYSSGVRAAEQLMSDYCAQKAAEEERRRQQARRIAEMKKNKTKQQEGKEDGDTAEQSFHSADRDSSKSENLTEDEIETLESEEFNKYDVDTDKDDKRVEEEVLSDDRDEL